jgi:hypothetical protein
MTGFAQVDHIASAEMAARGGRESRGKRLQSFV